MLSRAVVTPFISRITFDRVRTVGRSCTAAISPVARTPIAAVLVALSYYVGSKIGFFFTPSETPIATFWPPNAILLSFLLLTRPRIWGVLLAAVLPAHLLIQLSLGIPLLPALGWFAGNAGEALLGAACIRFVRKGKPLFESAEGLAIFLAFGVLLPTFVTSFVDAANVVLTGLGKSYWMLWTTRLTSNIVANLTIVPTIVIVGVNGLSWFRRASLPRFSEAGMLIVGVVTVSLLVFGTENRTGAIPALIYAPLPFLLWAAMRFGLGGLSVSMLAVALISLWNVMHGRGPFGTSSMIDDVLSLRILLMVFALPFMFMATLVVERGRSEEKLQNTRHQLIAAQRQERYRVARDLHDDIAQRLTLVGLNIDELRVKSSVDAKPDLDKVYDQISTISLATRNLSHDLYPFIIEYLGVDGALKKRCHDVGTQNSIAIDFTARSNPGPIPLPISQCLFGIAQKALLSIVKHAHARTATVQLIQAGANMLLRIEDDGPASYAREEESLEWANVREQLLSLHGTLKVLPAPLKGTITEASVPRAS